MNDEQSRVDDIFDLTQPLSEDWLRVVGFKWEQWERQPAKHWLLWLSDACEDEGERYISPEDIGVEVAHGRIGADCDWWHVWIRGDLCGRYTRFLHVRHMRTRRELVRLIEGITGIDWHPADAMYGSLRNPKRATKMRDEQSRLDLRMAEDWAGRAESERGQKLDKSERRRIGM